MLWWTEMSIGPKQISSAYCGSLVMVSSELFDPKGLIHVVSGQLMCLLLELCVVLVWVLF